MLGLAAGLAASLILVIAIAAGRSDYQGGWNPVLAFHYGYLTILIPLFSWIIVSVHLGPKWTAIYGTAVVLFFTLSFMANAQWRMEYIRSAEGQQQKISAELRSGTALESLVSERIRDFYFVDTPDVRKDVLDGIAEARRRGYRLYGGGTLAGQLAASSAVPSRSTLGEGDCQISELRGFHAPEIWGVWSGTDPAVVKLQKTVKGRLSVVLIAQSLNDAAPHTAAVTIGDETMKIQLDPAPRSFQLHYDVKSPAMEIELGGIHPISPQAEGNGGDSRALAIGLVQISCSQE